MLNFKRTSEAFALILLLTSSAAVAMVFPTVDAALYPGITIPTWAYLEVVPRHAGVGQTVLLVMWIDKPPPTALGILGDRWINMTIKITDPDGNTETLGPYKSDDAGGYTATYSPTKTGNYTAVFSYAGQVMTGEQGNPGFNNTASPSIGDVYGPSTSNTVTFTISDEPYTLIPENPIPTGYWENPVQAFNHYWYTIDGNWLGTAAVEFANTGNFNFAGNFNPYTQAPRSGHIVWAQPLVPGSPGGQMGGHFGGSEEDNYFSGFQYQPKFAPIIINGVLYYEAIPNYSTGGTYQGWVALDLRSGRTLWTKNYLNYFANGSNDILLCGQIYRYKTMNTYGGQTFLWATRTAGNTTNLDLFDAATGNYILTVTGGGGGGTFGRQNFEGDDGSLLQLYTNSSGGKTSLTLWNSSKCLNPGNTQFWGPTQNAVVPYEQGIEWTTILPNSTSSGPFPAGMNFILDDAGHSTWDPDNNIIIIEAGAGMVSAYGWNPGWLIHAAFDMNTGKQLWIKNQTETPFGVAMLCPGASNSTYAEFTKETMSWIGYSTKTGEKVWGPTSGYINPLAYYDQTSAVCAYGNLYTWTFGGEVYCYNMSTGAKVWNTSTGDAGMNTPYGVYPFWIIGNYEATVADGILFVESGHDYGPPLFSGAKIYAFNASTGEQIWDILNFATGSSLPITYGYMLSFNAYDNRIYCFGKGLTKTTVEASSVMNSNSQIQISGTVTDQSPGNTSLGIPAAGTPAIDDAYMSRWMEYLYMQSPKPTNATGVPVTLSYIDPNNNYFVIGTTTTDINGQYSYAFTPDVPGTYAITATFDGSNSYFASSAQTHTTIGSPSSTSQPTTTPATMADLYFLPFSIVIIAAIVVIIILLAVLLLRKHP